MVITDLVKINRIRLIRWLQNIFHVSWDICEDAIQYAYMKLIETPKIITKQLSFLMRVSSNFLKNWYRNKFNLITRSLSGTKYHQQLFSSYKLPETDVLDDYQCITTFIEPTHLTFMIQYLTIPHKKLANQLNLTIPSLWNKFGLLKRYYARKISQIH